MSFSVLSYDYREKYFAEYIFPKTPLISYHRSHIFQDLVESEILYTAVFSNEKTKVFAPEKLSQYTDIS